MTQHHPVFSNFAPYAGSIEQGFQIDFVGAKTRCEFQSGAVVMPTHTVQTQYAPIDEEYFEWIDILESVISAKQSYTIIELGAGYGRWAVRAACAINGITDKVTRRHIGTHDHDIERGLRKLLGGHGWHCNADYKCLSVNETPWGPVSFVDGVQSWVNPRLA